MESDDDDNINSEDEDWGTTLDSLNQCDQIERFNTTLNANESQLQKHKADTCPTDTLLIKHRHVVVHIDIDCFYAQVEMIHNPDLRERPLGIQQKNIIVTCNYVARKYGVTKLMYLADAIKKCPQLCVVKGEDLTHYRDMSYKITALLSKYSNTVERLGFDENFVDVTDMLTFPPWNTMKKAPIGLIYGQDEKKYTECKCGCLERLTIASHIAAEMRKSIHEELGLTGCAGIGHNKLLAKLVGETHKPNQQTVLYPHFVNKLMLSLEKPRKIPGIGHKTCERLSSLGINTIQELQSCSLIPLISEFGQHTAKTLQQLSLGIDDTEVVNTGKPQSLSDEDSFRKCDTIDDAKVKMSELLDNLLKRLQADGRIPQTLRITVRKLVPGVKYPNRQSRQGPIPFGTFNNFMAGDADKTQKKLLDMCITLFEKVINTTQKFHLTLINICFSNLQDSSSKVPKTGGIDSFFKSPKILKERSISDQQENVSQEKGEINNGKCGNQTSVFTKEKDLASDCHGKSAKPCVRSMLKTSDYESAHCTEPIVPYIKNTTDDGNRESKSNRTVISDKCSFAIDETLNSPKIIKSFFRQKVAVYSSKYEPIKEDTPAQNTIHSTSSHMLSLTGYIGDQNKHNKDEKDNFSLKKLKSFGEGSLSEKNIINGENSLMTNHTNISPVDYKLLVQKLGTFVDIRTFLELPLWVQTDIISQKEGLEETEVEMLINIVKMKGCPINVISEEIVVPNEKDIVEQNRFSKQSIDKNASKCPVKTKEVDEKYEYNELFNISVLDNGNVKNSSTKVKVLHMTNTFSSNSNCELSVPPDIDTDVFKELPSCVQKSLYNEWKTKVEFENMKKRKLSFSPEGHKISKKKTNSITNFFQKM